MKVIFLFVFVNRTLGTEVAGFSASLSFSRKTRKGLHGYEVARLVDVGFGINRLYQLNAYMLPW